jgi:hypothetical protein
LKESTGQPKLIADAICKHSKIRSQKTTDSWIYIAIMLLSGSHLPCTCGGIISDVGWKEHLYFNGLFIIISILSIRHLQKHKASEPTGSGANEYKTLSRA